MNSRLLRELNFRSEIHYGSRHNRQIKAANGGLNRKNYNFSERGGAATIAQSDF